MSNIALITNDPSHSAVVNAVASLITSGHAVDTYSDSNVSSLDLNFYDIVGTCRVNSSKVSDIAAKLKQLALSGIPILIDMANAGVTNGSNYAGVSTVLGLTGNILINSNTNEINITNTSHPITSGMTSGDNAVYTNSGYTGVFVSTSYSDILAKGDSDVAAISSYYSILALETGTIFPDSQIANARMVVFPVYLGGSATSFYNTILNNVVTWLTADIDIARVEIPSFRSYVVLTPPENAAIIESFRTYAVFEVTDQTVSKFSRYDILGPPDDGITTTKLARYDILMAVGSLSATKFSRYDILIPAPLVPQSPKKRRVQNTLVLIKETS